MLGGGGVGVWRVGDAVPMYSGINSLFLLIPERPLQFAIDCSEDGATQSFVV